MDETPQNLSENLEDYLEVISALSAENGFARLTDIANAMSVKKPSATAALNTLSDKGLVEYEKYKPVVLTEEGRQRAQNVCKKHKLLRGFFTGVLGVDEVSANIAACRMEHALDDSIMEKLVDFLKGSGSNSCSKCARKKEALCADCPHAVPLSELGVGERAVVLASVKSKSGGVLLPADSLVVLLRRAPLGDPVIVRVNDSEISLRKSQAEKIAVKRI